MAGCETVEPSIGTTRFWVMGAKARANDLPDPRTTSGPAVMMPRKQAVTCTRPQAERQTLLATLASFTHDPLRTRGVQPPRSKF